MSHICHPYTYYHLLQKNSIFDKAVTSNEYKAIFTKADGTTLQNYWLSSTSAFYNAYTYNSVENGFASYYFRVIKDGKLSIWTMYGDERTLGGEGYYVDDASYSLRPVVVLNSNIAFGSKNESGEWTLVQK